MEDLDGQYTLSDDSRTEKWCDIARQIESGHQMLLGIFDFDIVSLKAYMDRVALIDSLPFSVVWQSAEGGRDAVGEAFTELVDTFPLGSEILKYDSPVFRRSMVLYCSELFQAEAALKSGLTDKAWWHWSRACSLEWLAQGYYLGVKPATDKRLSGKKGGLTKEANKRQDVLNACITHLKKDRPLGGWPSPKTAIDVVAPKVEALLGKKSEGIDVRRLLYSWLNGEPDVQQAGGFRMRCTKE